MCRGLAKHAHPVTEHDLVTVTERPLRNAATIHGHGACLRGLQPEIPLRVLLDTDQGLAPGALLGSDTASLSIPSGLTLQTASIATPAVTFAAGDRLELDLIAPNDPASCGARLSYDGQTEPSKLTVPTIATVVAESVAGLVLLAPALPFGARWWKRRRP